MSLLILNILNYSITVGLLDLRNLGAIGDVSQASSYIFEKPIWKERTSAHSLTLGTGEHITAALYLPGGGTAKDYYVYIKIHDLR